MYKDNEVSAYLLDVFAEVGRQESLWGVQTHPIGNGPQYKPMAAKAKKTCDTHAEAGTLTYADILKEEVWEALAAETPAELVEELTQVCAVAISMIRLILDR